MILRPYQNKCVDATFGRLAENRSTLVVMATGLGKTVVFAEVARRYRQTHGGRVLVVVHRKELAEQAADKLGKTLGSVDDVGIEMAELRANAIGSRAHPVVVASVQTLSSEGRRERFAPDHFGLLIFDEAHHAVAATWRRVADYFENAKLLGVTATPNRADELALGQMFESSAFEYPIGPAIEDGWLVPVRQRAVVVDELDFSNVKLGADGDLAPGELDSILKEERLVQQMVKPTLDIVTDLPTLFFCAGVEQARKTAEVLNRYKPQSAEFLSGETPKKDRERIVARYRDGSLQFLANCMVFTEGFDAPSTTAVVMGRPTKSLPLYCQVLGRATRPLPGVVDRPDLHPEDKAFARRAAILASGKPACLVLDFVGNSGRHKLVTALDVLGGKFGEPVREYARKTQEEEEGAVLTDEALERAEAELALLRVDAERKRKVKARAATFRALEVSPFAHGGPTASGSGQTGGEPATDKQVRYLVYRAGWREHQARALSKKAASAIIGKHKAAEGLE